MKELDYSNFEFFANDCLMIRNCKTEKFVSFKLNEAQRILIRRVEEMKSKVKK